MFVSIAGDDEVAVREINKTLAATLREPEHFARVLNGEHDLNDADRDLIFRNRYLVAPVDVASRFSVEGLRESLNERLSEDRAEVVRQAIQELGLTPDRVTFVGIAAEDPISVPDPRERARLNRSTSFSVELTHEGKP